MVPKSFQVGDLVWAKMKGFPPWPGEISTEPKGKVKKNQHYVFFYGTKDYAWVPVENIMLHNEKFIEQYAKEHKRPATFKTAIDDIVNASKGISKYMKVVESSPEKPAPKKDVAAIKNKNLSSNSVAKKVEMKKKVPEKKHFFVKKDSRKRTSSSYNGAGSTALISSKRKKEDDFSALLSNIPPTLNYSHVPRVSAVEPEVSHLESAILSGNDYKDCTEVPIINLNTENELLKLKNIVPTKKKIGFLGLGLVGQGMVKNLIQSGHSVTVWNRTSSVFQTFLGDKGDESLKSLAGVEEALTPADVITTCDITFCCVSDPDVSKTLVFGNCGILNGLQTARSEAPTDEKKGFVEMTSLNPETSKAIADEVNLKGGRYLEAQLSGTRDEAEKGTLFILGAGDKSLFDDCDSCFRAMAKNSLFISADVGVASKFNIVHNMLLGTIYAAVAESLALVDRIGLGQSDFIDILRYGTLNTPVVIDKGKSMIDGDYTTSNMPLKHIQKNLKFALVLGGMVEQPMPITAAANEVYKHCKLLRYSEHDVSAVYKGTRH